MISAHNFRHNAQPEFPYRAPFPTVLTPAVEKALEWPDKLTPDDLYLMQEHRAGIVTPESQRLMNELDDCRFLIRSGVLNAPQFS